RGAATEGQAAPPAVGASPAGPVAPAPGPAGAPTLTPAPCPVPVAEGEAVDCFTLIVPEGRARGGGPTLALPVVRFRSRAAKPAEPLVFVGGGPGGSALGRRLSGAENHFLDERDVVLFAQRGTRFASPELACPGYERANDAIVRRDLGAAAAVALRREAAAECARQLRARGVDLDAYDTGAVVADLLDLRRALGVPAFSLYAVSYGTRVALEAMRREPSAVRSAVLDSVLPPDVRYDEMATDNALRALDRVLDQCAVDPACAKAYPDLRARWHRALERLSRAPAAVSAAPAGGGAKVSLRLTGRHVIEAVYSQLNLAGAIPTLPGLLDAVARGDVERVAAAYLEGAGPSGFAYGQRLSVWCRDEAPVTDPRAVAAQSSRHPAFDGWGTPAFDPQICRAWPVSPSNADRSAVTSDVPTLLFAGEYDPTTPPEWGRRALAGLKNGYFVELPGRSHAAGFGACGRSIALAFLRDPGRPPDTACAARAPAPSFTR
ncbi:MAG TPA: alpha/beta fold hydrolase, partial [Polyangiaceae bacterium]|nr:alpha/beta fold hydrolase [Polyangiaceae bacterium]